MSAAAIVLTTLASPFARSHSVKARIAIRYEWVDDTLPAIGTTVIIPKKKDLTNAITASDGSQQLAIRLRPRLPVSKLSLG